MLGPPSTLYQGEEFVLQFKFGMKYPFDSPEVTFVGPAIPVHQHIYSNGHICLSILTEDWSPALSVESVCLSVIPVLSPLCMSAGSLLAIVVSVTSSSRVCVRRPLLSVLLLRSPSPSPVCLILRFLLFLPLGLARCLPCS